MQVLVGCHIEGWVDLNQVHRPEAAGLRQPVADEVSLAVRQAAARASAGSRSDLRVASIDVKGQMEGPLAIRVHTPECRFHDRPNSMLVNLTHRKHMHATVFEQLLLRWVHVPETDEGHPLLC